MVRGLHLANKIIFRGITNRQYLQQTTILQFSNAIECHSALV